MQNKTEGRVYAGFFVRLAAYLIDSLIVGVVMLAVRIPLAILSLISPENILTMDFIFEFSVADIVIYVLSVTYFILLTYFTGATLGKRLMHIQVVSAEDRKMTFFEVVYRETIGRFLSTLIVYVGYIMIAIHGEKRGLHDLMSDTKVVYCFRKSVVVKTPIELKKIPKYYVPEEPVVEAVAEKVEEVPVVDVSVSEEDMDETKHAIDESGI